MQRQIKPVSRDIVSFHKTIRGMNKSIPLDGISRYRVSPLKLKLDIKSKMLMLNICSVNVGQWYTTSGPQRVFVWPAVSTKKRDYLKPTHVILQWRRLNLKM